MLMTSSVFGYVSENSRQGSEEVFSTSRPETSRENPELQPVSRSLVQEIASDPLAMLKDGLGSTIALANKGGNAVGRMNYDAFGNLRFPDKPGHGIAPCREFDLDDILDRLDGGRSFGFDFDAWHYGRHWGKALTPYLYTGRRIDAFSNLYNNRNRMLNPRVGRFLSRDPISFEGGLNLYGYCNNNPIRYTDPEGKQATLVIPMALITAVVGLHYTNNYMKTPAGQTVISDFKAYINQAIQNIELTFVGVAAAWDGYVQFARRRAQSDPYSLPQVNPGKECDDGKCKPCPKDGEEWEHTHEDGTTNRHKIVYFQDPITCECYPTRIHLP